MAENDMMEKTTSLASEEMSEEEIRGTIKNVYNALLEKGYNPIGQLAGYILSEDPTYITNHNGARAIMRKIDRDELLELMIKNYLGV